MAVNSVNSTNTTNNIDTNTSVDTYKDEYESLNKIWTDTYSTKTYLSLEFKEKIEKMLEDLKGLIDVAKEEEINEKIAESISNLITDLKSIINGSDSMMSLDQRINCLTALDEFKKTEKNKDLNKDEGKDNKDEGKEIYDTLNNTEVTYPDEASFYYALYSAILDNYSNRMDQKTKNAIQDLIENITEKNASNIDEFYSQFMKKLLTLNQDNLYSKDYTAISEKISNKAYNTIEDLLNALSPALIEFSVYKNEQENISSASRASLSNKTLSMKVMQESNAYKLLEIDNLMSETLNKRAEMDPAMKRLRDGNYWVDNKEVKPQANINPEDELWTKKQE